MQIQLWVDTVQTAKHPLAPHFSLSPALATLDTNRATEAEPTTSEQHDTVRENLD